MNAPVRHIYCDKRGRTKYTVVRHGNKQYELLDSRGRRIDEFPKSTVLYRLPELLRSDPHERVFVVEGEKDADRLAELGFIATTNPGGCKLGWKHEYSGCFSGRNVVIIVDNDKPGIRHAESVSSSLSHEAKSVVTIQLPRLKRAEDVSDWLDYRRGTCDELLKLVAAKTPTASPIALTGGKAHNQRDSIFQCNLPATQRLLLLAIHHRSRSVSVPTANELSEMTGLHRVSIQRLLKKLRKSRIMKNDFEIDYQRLACF